MCILPLISSHSGIINSAKNSKMKSSHTAIATATATLPAEVKYRWTSWQSTYRSSRVFPAHRGMSGFRTNWSAEKVAAVEAAGQSWQLQENPQGTPDEIIVFGPLSGGLKTLPLFR